MVRLHIKKGEESQFLYDTTVDAFVDGVINDVTIIYNGRLKVSRICYEIEELAKHGTMLPQNMMGLTGEQIEELKLRDEWGDKCQPMGGWTFNKDEIGRRNGRQPSQKMQKVLKKTIEDARTMTSKKLVLQDELVSLQKVQEALNLLRGAVTIVYPMGLPPHDVIRQEFENSEDLSGTQASLEVMDIQLAQLWFSGKELLRGKKLRDFLGPNEKTKVVVKLQKRGSGRPGREPVMSEDERKQLMLHAYRRQEELKAFVETCPDSDSGMTFEKQFVSSELGVLVGSAGVSLEYAICQKQSYLELLSESKRPRDQYKTKHLSTRNCSWTSCREGCTKELFECTQILVNYKRAINGTDENASEEEGMEGGGVEGDEARKKPRYERSPRDYNYIGDTDELDDDDDDLGLPKPSPTGLMGNDSEWFFTGAKLFPNVKGCGYPPMLNCSIFYRQYANVGHNFSCYYSKMDPGIVYMNLVYAMAIPIPSFIISVIYLTVAYFKIYTDDEEALVEKDGDEECAEDDDSNATPLPPTSGAITPGSDVFREDLASFGHQLKVAMADEMSRESLDGIPNSISANGNLSKTMTTSISTPPGPMAAV